jgi:hypothetical protein
MDMIFAEMKGVKLRKVDAKNDEAPQRSAKRGRGDSKDAQGMLDMA